MNTKLNLEQLQKKLIKVLDTNKFRFIFIFYPHIDLREDIKNYITENFTNSNAITLDLEKKTYQDISNILYENDNSFIFIDDFFNILSSPDLYNGFNQRRDKIASKKINLICFINSFNKDSFFKTAIEVIPDLLEFKNAIFEIEPGNNVENKLEIKEVNSSTYSSLGGLTTKSKREEIKRLSEKLKNVTSLDHKMYLYNQLATIYKDIGEYEESLNYQEKTLKLSEEILGENDLNLSARYSNISVIYRIMGKLSEALNYQEKALRLAEKMLGENDPDLATIYNNMSTIYLAMVKLPEALKYQEKALKLRKKILRDKHPDLAQSYNNISMIYQHMGKIHEALNYQEKALKLRKELLGDNHPDSAQSYNNIANIYRSIGELKKALNYQEKAIFLMKKILGDKHPELATSYLNIANIYRDLKDFRKEKEYIEKSIKIWKDKGHHEKDISQAMIALMNNNINIKQQVKPKINRKGNYY